jgi:hypothetical protein
VRFGEELMSLAAELRAAYEEVGQMDGLNKEVMFKAQRTVRQWILKKGLAQRKPTKPK